MPSKPTFPSYLDLRWNSTSSGKSSQKNTSSYYHLHSCITLTFSSKCLLLKRNNFGSKKIFEYWLFSGVSFMRTGKFLICHYISTVGYVTEHTGAQSIIFYKNTLFSSNLHKKVSNTESLITNLDLTNCISDAFSFKWWKTSIQNSINNSKLLSPYSSQFKGLVISKVG